MNQTNPVDINSGHQVEKTKMAELFSPGLPNPPEKLLSNRLEQMKLKKSSDRIIDKAK